MSGRRDLNQPHNTSPTLNQSFPTGTDIEGQYRIIDDAFSPTSEHDTAFVTDRHDRDRVRQCANQRECVNVNVWDMSSIKTLFLAMTKIEIVIILI